MEIILNEEEVAIDAILLVVKSPKIVDWKIHKEGKKNYYQIIRADGNSKMYMVFNRKLKEFDKEDLKDFYSLSWSPLSNDDVVNIALEGLPAKYGNVYDIIVYQEPLLDLKMVHSMLTTEEMRLKSRAQATSLDSSSSPRDGFISQFRMQVRMMMVINGNLAWNQGAYDASKALVKALDGKVKKGCFKLTNVGQSSSNPTRQETLFPNAFGTMTLHDPNTSNWNMDTVGNGYYIPVTNSDHSIMPTPHRTLHLNYILITPNIVKNIIYVRQFVRDDNCTVEFDAFSFSVKDFMTRRVLLCCDSTDDLYLVTRPSTIPHVFLTSQYTWHQRLRHPGSEVLHHLLSSNSFSCNKEKPPIICHAFQLDDTLSRYKARLVANDSIQGTGTAYLLLYVDDIVLTASSEIMLQQIIASLHQEFSMKDLGSFNYFIGNSVTRDSSRMFLSKRTYDVEILERAHMAKCNPIRAPVDTESKLKDDGDPVCLYMHDPWEPHFSALKWILRSTSGDCVFLGNNLLARSSKRQPTLSRSSTEAEYRGVANAVAKSCWLRNLLRELHTPLSFATLVYCDNVSAVYLSSNPVQHQRTKHIEIHIHFVRNLVVTGQVRVLHVPSRYHYADIFTKGLHSALFEEFRTSLSV
uniref:Ribonuclease H-like domain-containing protein n=1 Tax=Tanacetum cinerariifolium TaxID=118510 RepID=A0A6L2NE62_TANCI|nr:ribonuclease H-like domain-containing protein [Tanacetum cinerariifolium]